MPILAAGAGASEGLDTLLTRLMMEEQLAQRSRALDEEARHNQSEESLRGKQIDIASADRPMPSRSGTRPKSGPMRPLGASGILSPKTS
jgi:hypothetical protein